VRSPRSPRAISAFSTTAPNRRLPGHKTDQKDCERIAELLQHGLLIPNLHCAAAHDLGMYRNEKFSSSKHNNW
jgi:hypothetical protein